MKETEQKTPGSHGFITEHYQIIFPESRGGETLPKSFYEASIT